MNYVKRDTYLVALSQDEINLIHKIRDISGLLHRVNVLNDDEFDIISSFDNLYERAFGINILNVAQLYDFCVDKSISSDSVDKDFYISLVEIFSKLYGFSSPSPLFFDGGDQHE